MGDKEALARKILNTWGVFARKGKEQDAIAGLRRELDQLTVGDGVSISVPTPELPHVEVLRYAMRNIMSAIRKAEDAPCSSAQHERQAKLALQLGRIPSPDESMDWASEAPRDPEKWPCSFSYHEHASRDEAVKCALARLAKLP